MNNKPAPGDLKIGTFEKIKRGASKTSRPKGLIEIPDVAQRRIVSVSQLMWANTAKANEKANWEWEPFGEVYATFEGPTANESATEYIELMKTRTVDNGEECVADGVPLSKVTKSKCGDMEQISIPL